MRFGVAEAIADARAPGGGHVGRVEEGLEQADAAEADVRGVDVVDGERPAGEGQHLVERGVGIGLAEQFEAGLLELDRAAVALAEDGAEIGVGGGLAEQPSSR